MLLGTQSILMIPEDDDQAIQPFHASLGDFLKSEPRSGKFFINPPHCHLSTTTNCLAVMAVPPANAIVYDRGEYAWNYWCYHFEQGLSGMLGYPLLFTASLTHSLQKFASHSLQLWVNTLIHHGWKTFMDEFDSLQSRIKTLPNFSQDLAQILKYIQTRAKLDIENFKNFLAM